MDGTSRDDRTIHVSNLHSDVDVELLFELFQQAGPLQFLIIKGEGNRRYAFVEYQHTESIPFVCRIMDGVTLFDRELIIKPRQGSVHEAPFLQQQQAKQINQRRLYSSRAMRPSSQYEQRSRDSQHEKYRRREFTSRGDSIQAASRFLPDSIPKKVPESPLSRIGQSFVANVDYSSEINARQPMRHPSYARSNRNVQEPYNNQHRRNAPKESW